MAEIATFYEKYDGEIECYYGEGERISQVTRMVTGKVSDEAISIIRFADLDKARLQIRKEFTKIIEGV